MNPRSPGTPSIAPPAEKEASVTIILATYRLSTYCQQLEPAEGAALESWSGSGEAFALALSMAINEFTSWADLRRTQRLSGARLRDLQLSRLRTLLDHSYHHVPLYKDLLDSSGVRPEDFRSLADLRQLPVLRRQELQSTRFEHRLSRKVDPQDTLVRFTGGSSGRPLAFHCQTHELNYEALGWLRTWQRLGLKLTDHHATIKFPDDVIVSRSNAWYHRLRLLRVSYLDLRHPAPQLLDELARLQPDVLRAPPSILLSLARELDRRHERTELRPRLIFSTSERLGRQARQHLLDTFGGVIHDCYGATETGCIGWLCPECQRFHLNSDFVIVEVLKDGHPVAAGEVGEVVVTNLFRTTMPVIRHSLGDLGEVAQNNHCPMNSGPFSLTRIVGRTVDSLTLEDGSEISPYSFMPDDIPGVLAYQIVQADPHQIRIYVVPGADLDSDRLERERNAYEALLEGRMAFTFHPVETLPRERSARERRLMAPGLELDTPIVG